MFLRLLQFILILRKLGYRKAKEAAMTSRYEAFNEVTFEAYIKSAVDKSVLKGRLKKAARSQCEPSYSTLSDAALHALSHEDDGIKQAERSYRIFQVRGTSIPIHSERLGQALSSLMPRDREIILLYFFVGKKTAQIAKMMDVDPTTIQRRRRAAVEKLRDFMENTT